MNPDTTTSFEQRLDHWASKQGLFFIITTGRGSIAGKLMGVMFKLLILILIGCIIAWFYLKNRPETESFKVDLEQQIAKGLNAKDVQIPSISRVNGGILSGDMYLKSLELGETSSSFFKDWRVSEYELNTDGLRVDVEHNKVATFNGVTVSPLSLIDNYTKGWTANHIKISNMEISLKTGGDTDEEALNAYASMFRKYESLNIRSISIADGIIHWGTGEDAGLIKNAQFEIVKSNDSWNIQVSGGSFSYAWLDDVELINMNIICDPDGKVIVNNAVMKIGDGSLGFNAKIDIKAQPRIEGKYGFTNVKVLDLIGEQYEPWLGGRAESQSSNKDYLSFFSGTLNSAEGITYTTILTLGDEESNSIVIKGDNFAVLDSMQTVDLLNSYSRIRALKGKVSFKHQHLKKISDVALESVFCGPEGILLLNGEFQCTESDEIPFSLEEAQSSGKQFNGEVEMAFLNKVFQSKPQLIEVFSIGEILLRTKLNAELKGSIDNLTREIAEELETEIQRIKK